MICLFTCDLRKDVDVCIMNNEKWGENDRLNRLQWSIASNLIDLHIKSVCGIWGNTAINQVRQLVEIIRDFLGIIDQEIPGIVCNSRNWRNIKFWNFSRKTFQLEFLEFVLEFVAFFWNFLEIRWIPWKFPKIH